MVTQCQNQTQLKLTMIEQLHPSNKSAPLNTPACAVKPTSLLPIMAATGTVSYTHLTLPTNREV